MVEQLSEEDSYIYLNAIRGLSAMGNAFTDSLLPLLLENFRSGATSGNRVEFCLKIGEAIVRILRELGKLLMNLAYLFFSSQFSDHCFRKFCIRLLHFCYQ